MNELEDPAPVNVVFLTLCVRGPLLVAGLALGVTALSPLAADAAANKCTRLLPTGAREVIINQCSQCRIVNITRKRPGNAVPVSRSFTVLGQSQMTVPFRGPGRSRITSELPCKGDPGAAINLIDPAPKKKAPKVCVALEKSKDGGVLLVNSCAVCKAAMIERRNRAGGNPKRQAYRVEAKSSLPVPQNGAAKVGYLAEVDCPKG